MRDRGTRTARRRAMPPRQVVAGRVYQLSRRVVQRAFLLRPDEDMNAIYEYALGVSMQRYGVALHGWVAMSNHHHVLFTDVHGNFPLFIQYLHRLIAVCVNSLRQHKEAVWSSAQTNMVWCVEKENALDKLVYVLTNPVSAGLVERCVDWPGAISLDASLNGTTVRVARPKYYFDGAGKMPDVVELEATRLPGFEDLPPEEWKALLEERLGEAEAKWRAVHEGEGHRVLGRKRVLATDPSAMPANPPKKPERTAKNEGISLGIFVSCADQTRREHELDLLHYFREAYALALEAWRKRDFGVVFPFGAFKAVRLGALCATAPPVVA